MKRRTAAAQRNISHFRSSCPSFSSKLCLLNILSWLVGVVSSTALDKELCTACVTDDNCIYCRGNDFFENPSECVCEEFTGFFGSCSDYTFGADPYDSEWDCKFDREHGESFSRILIIVPSVIGSIIILTLCACFYCRSTNKSCNIGKIFGSQPLSTTTTTSTSVPHAFPVGTSSTSVPHVFPIGTSNLTQSSLAPAPFGYTSGVGHTSGTSTFENLNTGYGGGTSNTDYGGGTSTFGSTYEYSHNV